MALRDWTAEVVTQHRLSIATPGDTSPLRSRHAIGLVFLVGVIAIATASTTAGQRGVCWTIVVVGLLWTGMFARRRLYGPLILAMLFTCYGGLSSLAAVDAPAVDTTGDITGAAELHELGIIGWRPPSLDPAAFETAVSGLVTCFFCAMVVAWLISGRTVALPRLRRVRVRRLAACFLAIGLVGFALAAARVVVDAREVGFIEAGRQLWSGGAYFLFAMHFSIPGLALLAADTLERSNRRLVAVWLGLLGLLAVFSLATGQRAFAIEAGIAGTAVLVLGGTVRMRWVLILGLVALLGLSATQAVRDATRDGQAASVRDVAEGLRPDNAAKSVTLQIASFQWAVDVARESPRLRAATSPTDVFFKPIPSQLLPNKPAGFATTFTRLAHPHAARSDVTFAVPLYAEVRSYFGIVGPALAGLLVGLIAGLGLGPALVRSGAFAAIPVAGTAWSTLALIRGDLYNALPALAGWLIPVALLCWWCRLDAPLRGPRL